MTQRIVACPLCLHLRMPPDRQGRLFCDAFPDGDGIPANILSGENLHTTPVEGDHGIVFTPSSPDARRIIEEAS